MTILVTGGAGALANSLREFLPDAVYLTHAECDVTRPESIQVAFAKLTPSVVIHAAALTDHNAEPCEAMRVNALGTANVARWARAFGAKLVYLSTHYVYPGECGGYDENATLRPIGAYAWTKLLGERYAEDTPDALIVRGSWYTPAKLALWRRVGAFHDAWGSRESVRDASSKIAMLVIGGASGIYNIGGLRRTFHEIARAETHDYYRVPARSRERCDASYPFPRDASVSTAKFDAWARDPFGSHLARPSRSDALRAFIDATILLPQGDDPLHNSLACRCAVHTYITTPQRSIPLPEAHLQGERCSECKAPVRNAGTHLDLSPKIEYTGLASSAQGDGDPFFPVV